MDQRANEKKQPSVRAAAESATSELMPGFAAVASRVASARARLEAEPPLLTPGQDPAAELAALNETCTN